MPEREFYSFWTSSRPLPLPGATLDLLTSGTPWRDDHSHIVVWKGEYALVDDQGTLLRTYPGVVPDSNPSRLTPDRKTMLFAASGELHALDLDTGAYRRLSDLGERPGSVWDVMASDGEQVWFTWFEERGDLWSMDVESLDR